MKLKILIGTPCGNGVASSQYMLSLLDLNQKLNGMKHNIFVRDNLRQARANGVINEQNLSVLNTLESQNLIDIDLGIYTLANESLLTRGRNHIAAVAIRQGWDKLIFIDADAQFSFNQFISVVTSPHDLCAGACPLKILPISLNYLPFQKDEHYYKESIRSVDSLLKMRDGHKKQFVPVAYIGTAFMAISRRLLLRSAEIADEYQFPNPSTGRLHTHWNMFACKPMHGKFMSEDWYFCEMARQLGYEVMLDTSTIISHVGSMVFRPEMAEITHRTVPDPGKVDGPQEGEIYT